MRTTAPITCLFCTGANELCDTKHAPHPAARLFITVRAPEKIMGTSLPSPQDIYNNRFTHKTLCIVSDITRPKHTAPSLCCRQGGDYTACGPWQTDSRTASSTCEEAELLVPLVLYLLLLLSFFMFWSQIPLFCLTLHRGVQGKCSFTYRLYMFCTY